MLETLIGIVSAIKVLAMLLLAVMVSRFGRWLRNQ